MSHSRRSIAVLAHAQDGFWDQPRLVHLLMSRWEDMGLQVHLVTDPESAVPADVALLHVSLSVVPPDYRRLAAEYPRTLNGSAVDIRKRRYSRLLVEPGSSYRGAVIVKVARDLFEMHARAEEEGDLLPLRHELMPAEELATLAHDMLTDQARIRPQILRLVGMPASAA